MSLDLSHKVKERRKALKEGILSGDEIEFISQGTEVSMIVDGKVVYQETLLNGSDSNQILTDVESAIIKLKIETPHYSPHLTKRYLPKEK